MLARGEAVSNRMAILQAKLDEGGAQVGALAALAPAQTARLEAIQLETQAKEVVERERWAQILLLVAEAARSFGVWAFLMAGTRKSARYGRRAGDLDENHTTPNNVGDLRGPEPEPVIPAPIIPEPVIRDPITEPVVEVEIEPPAVDPIDAAIDEAVRDPAPRIFGDPKKGGSSNAMNHEINAIDDSIPIDPPEARAA